ncbi:MAG: response regulator [Gammaproteobacteria bacterium]|jgi:FixJ family two-component response regulator|nr:response regulator [Gammaproteobacteria bacterium]
MSSDQTVFVVDDDEGVREGLSLLLSTVGQTCELYASAHDFLHKYENGKGGCLVLDIRMPRMTGLDLQEKLIEMGSRLPVIFITGHGDIPMAVEAMRRGAVDFIRKPFREYDLLDRINEALAVSDEARRRTLDRQALDEKLSSLSNREWEVFERVANGDMNKVIAADLGISERTVEVHRGQVMRKLDVTTLAQLVRVKIESELGAEVDSRQPQNLTR